MREIKEFITRTYTTTDDREFDDKKEAEAWQEVLNTYQTIVRLDSNFKPAKEVDEAWYIRIDTEKQVEAFNAIAVYNGFSARVKGLGHYYYDNKIDEFISVHEQMQWLQKILFALNTQFTVHVPNDTDEIKRVDSL